MRRGSIRAQILMIAIVSIFAGAGAFFKWLWNKMRIRKAEKEDKANVDAFIADDATRDYLKELQETIKKDKEKFDRQNSAEVFADNFARMYGYGPEIASALEKINRANVEARNRIIDKTIKKHQDEMSDYAKSRIDMERMRQLLILEMVQKSIKGEHKTNIHRITALIREYRKDIADKSIPEKVRKDMEEDVKTLEVVLERYTNSYDDFTNSVYRYILDELKKEDKKKVLKDVTAPK